MTRGILIIALGHPFYGRMAHNLVVSLKVNDPALKIALVHDGDSLNHLSRYNLHDVFDELISCPYDYFHSNGKTDYIRSKLFMHDLSPFDETIYLDADMIALQYRKVAGLFDELSGTGFTMANHGFADLDESILKPGFDEWCKLSDVKTFCGTGKFYGLHSEFVYFKKSEVNKKYFDKAKELFDKCPVYTRWFAGSIPDEVPFALASILLNHYPHKPGFLPSFWGKMNNRTRLTEAEIFKTYYLYSIGGNSLLEKWSKMYNTLARWYFQQAGLQYPFQYVAKTNFIKQRSNA